MQSTVCVNSSLTIQFYTNFILVNTTVDLGSKYDGVPNQPRTLNVLEKTNLSLSTKTIEKQKKESNYEKSFLIF
jgi:hypothetical protein